MFKSCPEWDLPQSEVREALRKTQLTVRDKMSDVREALKNDHDIDWVIM